ncbi:MAG: FKBP-type peptidyl-prolyl cis-trans isomerase [Acidimicrobiales bacterium]
MTGKKRDRELAARRARAAALAAARRRRQRLGWSVAAAVAVVAVIGLVLVTTGGDDTPTASTTSSTVPPVEGSVAGRPCVAAAAPLPTGAPEVPVKVGPPPARLISEDLTVGTGDVVAPNSSVTVNYIGVSCSTGKVFDFSYGKQPATFPLNGVIPGWQEAIPGMKVGGKRLLGIPPDKGYGTTGQPPDIAPDETLWFVVEVLETKPA